MKRPALFVFAVTAFGLGLAFGPNRTEAARPKATPAPSAAPAALPTATPEPPQIAIPRLQAALKANPNDRQALAQLAVQYLGLGHPELVLPLTQRLIQLGEKTAQVYFYQGSAEESLGNVKGAVSDLESASNLDPTNVGVLSTLAQLYLRVNRASDAERVANRAVTFNKTVPSAYTVLGVVYASEQKWDQARSEFEQAYALDNKDVSPLLQEAQTYASQKALTSALPVVERAIAADPKNVQALVFKADLLAQQNQLPQASQAYDDAIAASLESQQKVGILVRKAAMYVTAKQPAQAEAVFASAIASYPTEAGAHVAFGEYYLQSKQTAKGTAQLQAALQVNRNEPSALLDLAQISLAAGKAPAAVGYLRQLTGAAPSAQSFALLGQAYLAEHNFTGAKDACGKSFQIQRSPDTLGCVAGSDFSLKNYREAAAIFDVLNNGVKGYLDRQPQLMYMAAKSYAQTNQRAKAIDSYKRLLRAIRPGTKEYKQVQHIITALQSKPAVRTKKGKG
ncbi:MAG: tetratricopeptide repeat protein [Candidatus Eremiobacteraeota bacterium]|nr:tetratricopeptide repeat protein [Candidatus Eremiobacteraeota bacterium]